MERQYYSEMTENLRKLIHKGLIQGKTIFLFGHCNATEELLELLHQQRLPVAAILDNNVDKYGHLCKGVQIVKPHPQVWSQYNNAVVCIVARAYHAMKTQLRDLGFKGEILKLVEYNTYSEYSLSPSVIRHKRERAKRGLINKDILEQKYSGYYKILCPFSALGDIFLTMSYLPHFLAIRHIKNCIVCVPGDACRQVAELFGTYPVETYAQKDLDELIQACIYTKDANSYIAHQDRPYVVNLHKALYIKCIPLETIYKCGVFGLPRDTAPYRPTYWNDYPDLDSIVPGHAVIFAPYAKSVTTFDTAFWKPIVADFQERGYSCFTNVAEGEKPLEGTRGISPQIAEMQSVVERAGTFIGIRSGLCDVIRYARCRKIALYPDYNYSDTKWKAIDMYALEGWENLVAGEDFVWNRN